MTRRAPKNGFLLVDAQREVAADDAVDTELVRRLLPYVKPHARLFVVAFLLMPVAAFAGLVQPMLVKRAVDAVVVDKSAEQCQRFGTAELRQGPQGMPPGFSVRRCVACDGSQLDNRADFAVAEIAEC